VASSAAVAAVGAPLGPLWLTRGEREAPATLPARPLRLPPDGTIRTAVAIGDGFNVIDVSGPWEALQDAVIGHGPAQFELYTAAESTASVSGTGGLRVTPAYSYDTAPQPHVVVIPAHGATPVIPPPPTPQLPGGRSTSAGIASTSIAPAVGAGVAFFLVSLPEWQWKP
jgi:hypothetical protein